MQIERAKMSSIEGWDCRCCQLAAKIPTVHQGLNLLQTEAAEVIFEGTRNSNNST